MTIGMNTAIDSAKEAVDTAKDAALGAAGTVKGAALGAAGTVKGGALDTAKSVMELISFVRGIDFEDVLGFAGLAKKRSPISSLALFGGGIALGAGIALLLAPVSGKDTRSFIGNWFGSITGRTGIDQVPEKVTEAVGQVKDTATQIAGQVTDKAEDLVGQAKDKAGDLVGQAKETVGLGTENEAQQGDEGGETEGRKTRKRHNHNAQMS